MRNYKLNLQDYVNLLQQKIVDNPELADAEVWTADDDEGNGYQRVGYEPSIRYIPEDSISYGKTESCYSEEDVLDYIRDYECIYPEDFDTNAAYEDAVKAQKEKYITVVLLN